MRSAKVDDMELDFGKMYEDKSIQLPNRPEQAMSKHDPQTNWQLDSLDLGKIYEDRAQATIPATPKD
jgi:hypothetical protein